MGLAVAQLNRSRPPALAQPQQMEVELPRLALAPVVVVVAAAAAGPRLLRWPSCGARTGASSRTCAMRAASLPPPG